MLTLMPPFPPLLHAHQGSRLPSNPGPLRPGLRAKYPVYAVSFDGPAYPTYTKAPGSAISGRGDRKSAQPPPKTNRSDTSVRRQGPNRADRFGQQRERS